MLVEMVLRVLAVWGVLLAAVLVAIQSVPVP